MTIMILIRRIRRIFLTARVFVMVELDKDALTSRSLTIRKNIHNINISSLVLMEINKL